MKLNVALLILSLSLCTTSVARVADFCSVALNDLPKTSLLSSPLDTLFIVKQAKLQEYGAIKIDFTAERSLSVIIDAKSSWLVQSFAEITGKPLEGCGVNDIKNYLAAVSAKLPQVVASPFTPYQEEPETGLHGSTFYFEQLAAQPQQQSTSLALLAKALFDTYTKKTTSLVFHDGAELALVVNNGASSEILIDGKSQNLEGGSALSPVHLQITNAKSEMTKTEKSFSVIAKSGKVLTFKEQGRTPFERLLKTQQEEFEKAEPTDLVPVEFYLLPLFYPTGHTVFRIGSTLYDFGFAGWSAEVGVEEARGYLFNNPFTKNLAKVYGPIGLQPFSIGATVMVQKAKLDLVVADIAQRLANREAPENKFCILTNNCSQLPLRIFENAGAPITSSEGIVGASSTLSFRELLLGNQIAVTTLNVYALPKKELTPAQYRNYFPKLLYRNYSPEYEQGFAAHELTMMNKYLRGYFIALAELNPRELLADWQWHRAFQELQAEGALKVTGTDEVEVTGLGRDILAATEKEFHFKASALTAHRE